MSKMFITLQENLKAFKETNGYSTVFKELENVKINVKENTIDVSMLENDGVYSEMMNNPALVNLLLSLKESIEFFKYQSSENDFPREIKDVPEIYFIALVYRYGKMFGWVQINSDGIMDFSDNKFLCEFVGSL